jgi:hypothetical protein
MSDEDKREAKKEFNEAKREMRAEFREAKKAKKMAGQGGGGGSLVYCLGLIGAIVYYIQAADSFWMGVLGFLKAFVWPAFLVYELLKSLGA